MIRVLVAAGLVMMVSGCLAVSAVSLAGSALVTGATLAGKTVYYTGKGVYQVGKLTVNVADGVLDGTERTLRLTILTANAAGAVTRTTREISAASLDAELAALERTDGVIEVFVDEAD